MKIIRFTSFNIDGLNRGIKIRGITKDNIISINEIDTDSIVTYYFDNQNNEKD